MLRKSVIGNEVKQSVLHLAVLQDNNKIISIVYQND